MKPERLVSLDALRGFTIIGMIIVNTPGSWSHVYAPLLHASWHGVTPTDLIFPFFLFMVGVSITLAFTKAREIRTPRRKLHRKVLVRSLKIFALGLFLNLWPEFDFSELRVAGVLQRIALVFAACALIFLNTKWRTQVWIGIAILVGYWGLLSLVPVPVDAVNESALRSGEVERSHGRLVQVDVAARGEDALEPNYEPGVNLAAWIDRRALPGSLWERTWDPEGLLSTLPAIATGIFGMLIGQLVLSARDPYRRVSWVFFVGFCGLLCGLAWDLSFPINKNLWSSSFVVYSGGWACLCFAATILIADVLRYQRWTRPGVVFGANPLVAYALASMLTVVFYSGFGSSPGLNAAFMDAATGAGLPPKLASLVYALLYVGVIYLPVLWLWKRRLFLRI